MMLMIAWSAAPVERRFITASAITSCECYSYLMQWAAKSVCPPLFKEMKSSLNPRPGSFLPFPACGGKRQQGLLGSRWSHGQWLHKINQTRLMKHHCLVDQLPLDSVKTTTRQFEHITMTQGWMICSCPIVSFLWCFTVKGIVHANLIFRQFTNHFVNAGSGRQFLFFGWKEFHNTCCIHGVQCEKNPT